MQIGWRVGCVVLSLFAVTAAAEDKVRIVQEADRTVVRERTTVDFTEANIEGELTKPEGSFVLERSRSELPNLLTVRNDFAFELHRSVDHF